MLANWGADCRQVSSKRTRTCSRVKVKVRNTTMKRRGLI